MEVTSYPAIEQMLTGGLEALSLVEAWPHANLRAAVDSAHPPVVTADAVSGVLHQLRSGRISPGRAHRWASLVRRGYVARANGKPIEPIEIECAADAEDAIVEAISRLDEIGDRMDGTIDADELDQLLRSLPGTETRIAAFRR